MSTDHTNAGIWTLAILLAGVALLTPPAISRSWWFVPLLAIIFFGGSFYLMGIRITFGD